MISVSFTWEKIELVDREGQIVETHAMIPLARFDNVCASQFVLGTVYRMDIEKVPDERSDASHKHYMASVVSAWRNLPEKMAAEYPTPDHLRKRALIKCGYYHCDSKVFDTPADATRAAAFVKPMDPFAVTVVKDCVVNHYRAKSQKFLRAGGMDKAEFQASKDAVLALLAEYIGVKKSELEKQGAKGET